MRQRLSLVLVLLGGLACPVFAGDFVCGDATQLQQFTPSSDPTKVPACPAPFLLSEIPEPEIPAQRTLYASLPPRYLKVVDGLMLEMTQEEKDDVDAPHKAEAALVQEAKKEQAEQEYCSIKTLQQVTAKILGHTNQIHAHINAVHDIDSDKEAQHTNFDIVMTILDQLSRCVRATRTAR
jgi:hypothetical protein